VCVGWGGGGGGVLFNIICLMPSLYNRVCYERLVAKSEYRECDLGLTGDYDKVTFYTHQSKVLDNACGKCCHIIFVSIDYITYHNVYLYHILCMY